MSFKVRPHQTMGLVGESGCGKSITSLTIMGLLDPKAEVSGEIIYDGKNLLSMTEKEKNTLRGREIAMIYQDALSSLNPSMLSLTDEAAPPSAGHPYRRGTPRACRPRSKRTLDSYPHELRRSTPARLDRNGSHAPKIIIADEPTTALDVTVQNRSSAC
ncbi:MAG: ATP-binding cassette domain-containing protein [Slackia sp.]